MARTDTAGRKRRHEGGYSLIEMIIVIVIIGIMATMAAMGMNFVRRQRVTSTAKEIASDLQKARINALTLGPTITNPLIHGAGARFDSATAYTTFIFNDKNNDYQYETGEESTSPPPVTRDLQASSNVTLKVASFPAYNVVIFDRFGTPTAYKPDGTQQTAPLPDGAIMDVTVSDPAVNDVFCIKISMNSVREGAWNAASSTCNEL